MGNEVFYWFVDGMKVNFLGGSVEDYFYEWIDFKECVGERVDLEYVNLICDVDIVL